MNRKIKLISSIAIIIILFVAITSCNNQKSVSTNTNSPSSTIAKININVAALKGPTGMGMVMLMEDSAQNKTSNNYNFTIAGSPDEIVGKISSGEIQIAAIPSNLAASLYNKTNGKIQIAAINTLGVLYVLEKGNTINSVTDLKGKTIGATGQGSTPEYILNYILQVNGLSKDTDVTIDYKTEHSELATLAISGKADIVMLPEPFVTTVLLKDPSYRIALNLTDEFKKASEKAGDTNSILSMGCLVVSKAFAQNNKEALNSFLDEYKASANYANSNKKDAAVLIEKYEIATAAIAEKAIPTCNIVFIEGNEMINSIKGFYDILYKTDPKSLGGALPDANFYYTR